MRHGARSIASLATLADSDLLIAPETPTEDVLALFEQNLARGAVTLGVHGRPTGMITRQGLLTSLSSPYGNALYRTRPIARVAARTMLVVEVSIPLEQAVRQARSRSLEARYDPLVVVDAGRYIGLVDVSHLLDHLNDSAMLRSRMSHPLTGLPGAPLIEAEINARLGAGFPLAVVRMDLTGFGTYVARHASTRGDAVLLTVARVARGGGRTGGGRSRGPRRRR